MDKIFANESRWQNWRKFLAVRYHDVVIHDIVHVYSVEIVHVGALYTSQSPPPPSSKIPAQHPGHDLVIVYV